MVLKMSSWGCGLSAADVEAFLFQMPGVGISVGRQFLDEVRKLHEVL